MFDCVDDSPCGGVGTDIEIIAVDPPEINKCCETCRFADLTPVVGGWVVKAGLIDCERKEEFLELGVPTPAFFVKDFGCNLWEQKEE